ncbi:MAG: phytanoyl-CoA dioxygenase family protein [Candidatus Latescibacterota bacterium]|nr:phytanoyl-CoA dioxygenase family protein [Candidatus Latescibacterota bacterium]
MTNAENYLMDVHGYLVIEAALSQDEVATANAAIDRHAHEVSIRPNDLAHESDALRGTTGRGDLAGALSWNPPDCDPFREMMVHPRITPYLEALLGTGFHLEGIQILTMDEGAEGFWFHEGGEPIDRSRSYLYRNGRMYSTMTNIAVQLTDVGSGDGGFACLPGSHKANFACPDDIRLYESHHDRIVQIPAKAGDAILFVECLMHGALPWRASHQRRTVILRYNNGVTAEGVMGTWTPPEFFEDLSPEQQAVISHPHYRREDKGSRLYQRYR